MKIIIAPDSFKGTMTAPEAAEHIAMQLRLRYPDAETVLLPVGDGGEGTAEAIVRTLSLDTARDIRKEAVAVCDPLRRPLTAAYYVVRKGNGEPFALMESASASGLTLVRPEERDIMKADTYGTGLLLADAISRGIRDIRIGMGGTATCDCGYGALQALRDKLPEMNVPGLRITLLCDVRSPLCGKEGAAYVFGPQKGADAEQVARLDVILEKRAAEYAREFGRDVRGLPYAGAAGGLAAMLMACFGAEPVSGIDMVLETIEFTRYLQDADMVVTGEGRADASTLAGKAAKGILDAVKRYNAAAGRQVPVVLMPGCFHQPDIAALKAAGFIIP